MRLLQRVKRGVNAAVSALSPGAILDAFACNAFPGWGAKRLDSRVKLSMLRRSLGRSLQAGGRDRLGVARSGQARGPAEKTRQELASILSQARILYRKNPYARGVTNSLVANLIGGGIYPLPQVLLPKKGTPDQRYNDIASDEWKFWAERCDITGKECFYEQQAATQRELIVGGECLVVSSVMRDGRKIPLATSVLPSERLAMLDEPKRADGSSIQQGIEFTAAGKIRGYWLYPNHPSDGYAYRDKPYFASAENVIHVFDKIEPEQIRGLSKFETTAGAFEGFMEWMDWLLTKERIAAAFAIAITDPNGNGPLPSVLGPDPQADGSEEYPFEGEDVIEGGMIGKLRAGQDIKSVASGVQASNVETLCRIYLSVIARGFDCAYELVARDLSKVTYLSARQGVNEDRRHWAPQQEFLNRRVNAPIYGQFITLGNMVGAIPSRGDLRRMCAVDFVRPGLDWIDPGKDVAADVAAINAGLKSPIKVAQSRGEDLWKIYNDIALSQQWQKELGIRLPALESKAEPGADVPEQKEEKVKDEDA